MAPGEQVLSADIAETGFGTLCVLLQLDISNDNRINAVVIKAIFLIKIPPKFDYNDLTTLL